MGKDLLQEARKERRERQGRKEIIRPLREGFERLLETYGTPVHKLALSSRAMVSIDSMLGGKSDSIRLLASLGDLKHLWVTLGRGRDQVQVAIWDWFDSQIVIRVGGLPERLVLKAELEKSRIEEWKTVAEMEEAEEDLFVMPPFIIPMPSAVLERLKIEERWIPTRFPDTEDITCYQVLLEGLERELGSR